MKRLLKCYIDTEFKLVNLGSSLAIQPISFGAFVPEQKGTHNQAYGFHYTEFEAFADIGDKWLNDNVMSKLSRLFCLDLYSVAINMPYSTGSNRCFFKTDNYQFKSFFEDMIRINDCDEIVIVCDFLAYDFVVMAQLFGSYFDIPKYISLDPIDISSIARSKGIDIDVYNEYFNSIADVRYTHNAYYDAMLINSVDEHFKLTEVIFNS